MLLDNLALASVYDRCLVHRADITSASQKLQKKPLFVIMLAVEGLGDGFLTRLR